MAHHTTSNLTSPATPIPEPPHDRTTPAGVDGSVDRRGSKVLARRRGFLRSSQLGDTTGAGLTKPERRLSAVVLIAAPLSGLVGALLIQDYGGDMSQELNYITAHDTRWLIANYFTLLMGSLMAMAIGILTALVRRRAPGLGYFGGALAILGIYFHGSVVGYSLVQAPLVGSDLPKDGVLKFTQQAMYEHAAFTAILLSFLSFFLGMVLLAAALWRARITPAWVTIIIAGAPFTEFLGLREVSPELMFVLFTIGFGYIALQMVRRGAQSQNTPVDETHAAGGPISPTTNL